MLPFNSIDFLIIMAIYIGLLLLLKIFTTDKFYPFVLFFLNFSFIFIAFPNGYHLFAYVLYAYIIVSVDSLFLKLNNKLPFVLLLVLPLFLVKLSELPTFNNIPFATVIYFAGISFVTFRSVSYYMDKSNSIPMANPISFFNYLTFVPTLLIGPIDRFAHFESSQKSGFTNINSSTFIVGWNYFVKGVAFKYVFAEIVDRYWLGVSAYETTDLTVMANVMYSYYFYLFFDFAGYSYMAMGIAKMMGIEVPLNFKNPFVAKNPQEFWQSFHITLGAWLKDYFFTPINLFLGRKKYLKPFPLLRQNTALFLTFLLMGCWNGLEKHYIASGALFGIYSFVHNAYKAECKKRNRDILFGNAPQWLVNAVCIFIMFNLVAFAMYIFSGKYPNALSFQLI
jgi:membrane protein involved in D-alanine export